MILTIYDLSGIQSYIFATNKLKEMIGASFIVNEALFKNIPELFIEEIDVWETEAVLGKFEFKTDEEKKIVYIGGGNALVMYRSEDTEKKYTRELQKLVFEQTGGALKLCTASICVKDYVEVAGKLAEIQKDLMARLDDNKRRTPNISTAKGFSINAHDNINFEPVLLFDKGFATKSKYYKIEMYEKKRKKHGLNIIGNLNTDERFSYVNSFNKEEKDKIKDEDLIELYFIKQEAKNYLAIIHIDGNTMGIKIRKFVEEQQGNLFESLGGLRKLSYEINNTYQKVLTSTINEVYAQYANKLVETDKIRIEIPFRPIIVDGDDVTVICAAENAFDLVKIFMKNLSKKPLDSFGDESKLTAAAGIAFVNVGFPFHTAYDMAEQCCKNAKSETLKRGFDGDIKDNKSSIDFQICYSGVTNKIKEFRTINYIFNGTNDGEKSVYKLNIRPYIFEIGNEIYSYENGFEKNIKDIANKIARSKLKAMRNNYGKGVLSAKTYGEFLLARSANEDEENQKTAKLLSSPFLFDAVYKNKDGKTEKSYFAKFFDVLDVLEFISPDAADEDKEYNGEIEVTADE